MGAITDFYKGLLLKQYFYKDNASAEIEAMTSPFETMGLTALDFVEQFNLDTATGDRLDIIGKIVGVSRTIPQSFIKNYFGFSENSNALSFNKAPMWDENYDTGLTATELNDDQLRFFIRAKIIKNIASTQMSNSERQSLLESYIFLLENRGYIVDNKDMSMTVYVDNDYVDEQKLILIIAADLFITPMGVQLYFVNFGSDGTFGFNENPLAVSFGDGKFAEQLYI